MQQYMQMKERYSDCIVLFRMGDFYEMFFQDAETVSQELELTLTGKSCGLEERAPMCGIPYHAVNAYIPRLLEHGHKVAICEQLEDPALAKGLVKRDVIRVITPGTVSDPTMLDEKQNNFLLSVCFSADRAGLAYADVSTGECFVDQVEHASQTLADVAAKISPQEIITNDAEKLRAAVRDSISISLPDAATFGLTNAKERLTAHFRLQSIASLGLTDGYQLGARAAGALLTYLHETQKNSLEHITGLRIAQGDETMMLDRNTRRNLELTESMRGQGKRGSLLWLLDKTATAMGGRLLKTWIEQPLLKREAMERRLDAVEELTQNHVLTMTLAEQLKGVYDLERLLSKVAYHNINARDCLALAASLHRIPAIRSLLAEVQSRAMMDLRDSMNPLAELTALLDRAIHPDAPFVMGEGGIIAPGYNKELDEYRDAAANGRQWIAELELREREATGIRNLRVTYNKVFGYAIEVTKSFLSMVPEHYHRKQTLANAERYITEELREIERKITGAQEQSIRLETELFAAVRESIAEQLPLIQQTAVAVKTLDALLSLAQVAVVNHYVRPALNEDGHLNIVEGRHPVVEQTMADGLFVPNDTSMNQQDERMLILTGPNMAGKSTYMRQVALIVLMAHIGSFVPAQSAEIPLVDRIFTRVGASDDLASGQSTFMVEMAETAYILRNATARSLILLDEIGRGTSTFDGLSIAWAVVEFLANTERIGAKTLFATHYHELSELEGHVEGVVNYCISVREHGEDVLFLRKIVRGGADKSFGVHVAKLAGIPNPVLMRAREIQARLEVNNINQNTIGQNILGKIAKKGSEQVALFDYQKTELIEKLKNLDVMALTPMDAINQLFLFREEARKL